MHDYLAQLQKIPLFSGILPQEMITIISCLNGQVREYDKDQIIFDVDDQIDVVGILLEGKVQIVKDDAAGNRNILKELAQTGVFAEALSFAALPTSPFSVIAAKKSRVLFLPLQRLIKVCSTACSFHTRMIENALRSLAQENIFFNEKIDIISQRTLRARLWRYLTSEAQQQGKTTFSIPFNRSELADFLCVDRSAMSRELSKMAQEGLITYEKNRFSLPNISKG